MGKCATVISLEREKDWIQSQLKSKSKISLHLRKKLLQDQKSILRKSHLFKAQRIKVRFKMKQLLSQKYVALRQLSNN